MVTGNLTIPPYQIIGSTVESLASNPGYMLLKEQSFSAAATTQVTDAFGYSNYQNYSDYLILLNCTSSVVNNYIQISFLQNATVLGAGTYINAGSWFYYGSGATGSWSSTNASGCFIGYVAAPSTTNPTIGSMIVRNPLNPVQTTTEQIFDMGGNYLGWGASRYPATTSINGFQISQQGGGNLTGSVSVFGYRTIY